MGNLFQLTSCQYKPERHVWLGEEIPPALTASVTHGGTGRDARPRTDAWQRRHGSGYAAL